MNLTEKEFKDLIQNLPVDGEHFLIAELTEKTTEKKNSSDSLSLLMKNFNLFRFGIILDIFNFISFILFYVYLLSTIFSLCLS